MNTQLDMDKSARGLGAERIGKLTATGGYFGAAARRTPIEPSGGFFRSHHPLSSARYAVPAPTC